MGLEVTATYGRASELCKTETLTGVGQIKDEAGKLYWLLITNTDSSTRHCTLHNALTGTSNEIHKFYIPGETTKPFNFDPPIPFDTGIRIGAVEHSGTVTTGGYR